MSYFYPQINVAALEAEASNVRGGENPPFTKDDFCYGDQAFFPHFKGLVEDYMLDQFILMANSVVQEARWHEHWKFGMALYVAHMATLYLETMTQNPNPSASQVINAAKAKGLQTSKSVGSLSVSYSFEGLNTNGWQDWQTTKFGRQFVQIAKFLAKAGMYVR